MLEEEDGNARKLVDCGVRIFSEVTDPQKRESFVPKNRERRQKRGMRRNLERRAARIRTARDALVEAGLLPLDEEERNRVVDHLDPYEVRARALDEKLSLHQIGRALFHLAHRRGFKSNRKALFADLHHLDPRVREFIEKPETDEMEGQEELSKEEKKEQSETLKAIAELRQEIEKNGCRTLGEYLYRINHEREPHDRLRARERKTDRAMYEEEFEAIWAAQQPHYPDLLTDGLRAKLFHAIFFQRPLRRPYVLKRVKLPDGTEKLKLKPKGTIGRCQFERHHRRADRALLLSQEFRIWQDLAHIEVLTDNLAGWRFLTLEERNKIYAALHGKEEITWKQFRKVLGLSAEARINFEVDGGKKKFAGNITDVRLRRIIGDEWDAWPRERKDKLVESLLTITDKADLVKHLLDHPNWRFDPKTAYRLAILQLPGGVMSLSARAMDRILYGPKPKGGGDRIPGYGLINGQNYHDACQAAGYLRADQISQHLLSRLPKPELTRNPVVDHALHQVRKLVNAIIREYGRPDAATIEMARDMKLNREQRERILRENRENREQRDWAVEKAKELGIEEPSSDQILWLRLLKECNYTCPYTGKSITERSLLTGDFEVEHIIPYSRCLDDSYMNKTLCDTQFNRHVKRNKTPYELFSSDEQRYGEVKLRIQCLPKPKQKKFEQIEIDTEQFVSRQLNDTRYICRATKDYLKQVIPEVDVSRGGATAALRHVWGLNGMLPAPPPDSEKAKAEKRTDHRHHAIDAVVIACTTRSLLKRLSDITAKGGSLTLRQTVDDERLKFPPPWPTLRDDVKKALDTMVVSFAPTRKLFGGLHEEGIYGVHMDGDRPMYHIRKRLEDLSAGQIEDIRDPELRKQVKERVTAAGGDLKKAFAESPTYKRTRVRRARICVAREPKATVQLPHGHAFLGSYHHVEILECLRAHQDEEGKKWKVGQRKGVFVSMLEAAERAHGKPSKGIPKRPIVQRDHGPDWRFVMSLSQGDLVRMDEDEKLYRVQKFGATAARAVFREATLAGPDEKWGLLQQAINVLRCTKVNTDLLGRVFPAND